MTTHKGNKIVIIGTGAVGATTAFTLMQSGLVSETVLIDIDEKKAEGEVMDLNHGLPYVKAQTIRTGTYADCKNANLIIMTAGPSIPPGGTRLDLAKQNSRIMAQVMKEIVRYTRDAIILIASNPVDILTQVAVESVAYDPKKVIGSGTVLDSARFRYLLSENCGIDSRNVHGYILGEHGDSEVAAWSLTHMAGTRLDQYCQTCTEDHCKPLLKEKIFEQVRDAGYQVIARKSVTQYGVSLAIKRISEAILRNEQAILTVSSMQHGAYGLSDVALSVPTIIGAEGIHRVLELPLDPEEQEALQASGAHLQQIYAEAELTQYKQT